LHPYVTRDGSLIYDFLFQMAVCANESKRHPWQQFR
jgi:hypothetical protein